MAALPPAEQTRQEVVFIDPTVPDAAGLAANAAASGAEVHVLQANRDGLQQIAEALAGKQEVDDVHIVSHGAEGELFLGDLELNLNNLGQHKSDLESIARSLAPGSDLLLYGCDVAEEAPATPSSTLWRRRREPSWPARTSRSVRRRWAGPGRWIAPRERSKPTRSSALRL